MLARWTPFEEEVPRKYASVSTVLLTQLLRLRVGGYVSTCWARVAHVPLMHHCLLHSHGMTCQHTRSRGRG